MDIGENSISENNTKYSETASAGDVPEQCILEELEKASADLIEV